ncbi:MAG: tRNA/rRNA methyltransferase SpoU [Parcubacteria group bacterium Licking1014_17]|nr:MAG: tRNA/rRNA methyltransferase SpoU [Parcubacteria group bacterium Licking1014_17]
MEFKQQLALVIHCVRSAYNVGSIMRTADAMGVSEVFICGYSPTPNSKKVAKTSLGAEKVVPWKKYNHTWELLRNLKSKGYRIAALEINEKSSLLARYKPKFPLALMVGNEKKGLSKIILKYTDNVIKIPMHGKKESLNVAVATGIALYKINERRR